MSAAPAYFLCSARLGFRPWSGMDIDLARSLWTDAESTRLIGGPFTSEQCLARLQREMTSQRDYGIQYWPIFLIEGGAHVGICGLRPYQPSRRVHELGFQLRREFWGRGLATEAARAVIAHAFGPLGAAALFAGHHPENQASRRVLTKLGFEYTHDEFYAPTGLMHPSYSLSPERWKASETARAGGV